VLEVAELWIIAAAVEAGELSWIEERAVLGCTSGAETTQWEC
jgi:hypothetical protein